MKISFTTLGNPNWTWEHTLEQAQGMGYDGIEIRGVEGEMNLPKARPFLPSNLSQTKAQLGDLGLTVCCLGTSCRFDDTDGVAANIDLGKAHIDLAAELGCPYIRVFGDRIPSPDLRPKIVEQVAGALVKLADYARGTGVTVLQETHGDFSRSEDILEVMTLVQRDEVKVLWDIHHPYRFFGEQPEETWERLGSYVAHTHWKDSRGTKEDFQYCRIGEGDVPVKAVLKLLKDNGYAGWLSLEWEKQWHPELEEPELIYPHYLKTMRDYWEEV
ncbi:MAG: sugar phosphate isomerase/epimerase [Firmicutes bacterium]|nr:sugar phosphate isomerase/epimerase [Bacillota bacterium]